MSLRKRYRGGDIDEPLLLWTNPNSYFNGGYINLSFDTSKYKYLVVSVCAQGQLTHREQLALICEVDKVCIMGQTYEFAHNFGTGTHNRSLMLLNKTSSGEVVNITEAEGDRNSYNYPKRIWALAENTKMPVIS